MNQRRLQLVTCRNIPTWFLGSEFSSAGEIMIPSYCDARFCARKNQHKNNMDSSHLSIISADGKWKQKGFFSSHTAREAPEMEISWSIQNMTKLLSVHTFPNVAHVDRNTAAGWQRHSEINEKQKREQPNRENYVERVLKGHAMTSL